MYVRAQIVKYAASLTTVSLGNRRLTANSQWVSLFRTPRFKTPKLDQLTDFISLQDIVNIAKIHRLYSWDVRGWCSDKKEGIILSVDTFKEENKSTLDPSSRPPSAWSKPL